MKGRQDGTMKGKRDAAIVGGGSGMVGGGRGRNPCEDGVSNKLPNWAQEALQVWWRNTSKALLQYKRTREEAHLGLRVIIYNCTRAYTRPMRSSSDLTES